MSQLKCFMSWWQENISNAVIIQQHVWSWQSYCLNAEKHNVRTRLPQDTQQKCQTTETRPKRTGRSFHLRHLEMLARKKNRGSAIRSPSIRSSLDAYGEIHRVPLPPSDSRSWAVLQQEAEEAEASVTENAKTLQKLNWLHRQTECESVIGSHRQRQLDYRHFDKQVGDTWSGKFPLSIWFCHRCSSHTHTHMSSLSNNALTVGLIESIVPWLPHNNSIHLYLPAWAQLWWSWGWSHWNPLQTPF